MRARAEGRPVRGFTLIEVLAALVIVALGMLGVIDPQSSSRWLVRAATNWLIR